MNIDLVSTRSSIFQKRNTTFNSTHSECARRRQKHLNKAKRYFTSIPKIYESSYSQPFHLRLYPTTALNVHLPCFARFTLIPVLLSTQSLSLTVPEAWSKLASPPPSSPINSPTTHPPPATRHTATAHPRPTRMVHNMRSSSAATEAAATAHSHRRPGAVAAAARHA